MRRNQPVKARNLHVITGRQKPGAFQPPPKPLPEIYAEALVLRKLRMTRDGQFPQPRPRNRVRRKKRRELQRRPARRIQTRQRRIQNQTELPALRQHLRADVRVGSQSVHRRQAPLPKHRQKRRRRHLRMQPQKHRHLLHRKREAPQVPRNLTRSRLVPGARKGGRSLRQVGHDAAGGIPRRLVIPHDRKGRILVQSIHGNKRKLAPDRGNAEARRGHNPKPAPARPRRQRRKLRQRQQLRLRNVVQKNQNRRLTVGVRLLHRLRALTKVLQNRLAKKHTVVLLLLGGRETQLRLERKLADQRQKLLLPLSAQRPQPPGIAVRKPVRIRHRKLRLALTANAVQRRHHSHRAHRQVFVKAPEFLVPAQKVRVLAPKVPRRGLRPARALNALPQADPERLHPLPDLLPLQRQRTLRIPGTHVREVPPLNIFQPARARLLVAARDLDEVHRRDAVRAHELMDLAAEVLVPLPAAVLAREVVGRQAHEQYLRLPQRAEDPVPPVVNVVDLVGIEEDAERLGGEALMVRRDVVANGGHPAARVALRYRPVVLP